MSTSPPNFAVYYAGDAYSTSRKIMGRQSAGKAFMKGVARTWPTGPVRGLGASEGDLKAMAAQLRSDGFDGQLQWSNLPSLQSVIDVGALYFPSPCPKELAHLRNLSNPASFSFMGVTHTMSSAGAMDNLSDLILPPFRPWDALICTSNCAKQFTERLHQEMKDWWRSQAGDMQFNAPQLPVIWLGVDAPFFSQKPNQRVAARQVFDVQADETVFLFSGRLSFHAKANPAPMYQALEKASLTRKIVCIEAGVFPNEYIQKEYIKAQQNLAPHVRFIWADGQQPALYQQSWQAADVFISLSDNIQETFGLTPVEAMAAGLPVIVADWNGYKDTVRDGIDGYRIPTTLPPPGVGGDLAVRHALELDTYDYYIGRTSLATVIHPDALAAAVQTLSDSPALRAQMGAAGLKRVQEEFDWPVILRRYTALADELTTLRAAYNSNNALTEKKAWPHRADPFQRFAHFPSQTLQGNWAVVAKPDSIAKFKELSQLSMASYAFDKNLLPPDNLLALLQHLSANSGLTINALLSALNFATPLGVRSLLWLWKFDLIEVHPAKV
jgi:glycosyltransferase involved in cell wall biosynthesis